MNNQPEKNVKEIVEELVHRIYEYEDTRGNVEIKLTQTLTAERQRCAEAEQKWSEWRSKYKAMEQSWMHLKDQYTEIGIALGFEGDAWFGDPLADHGEIVSRAKMLAKATPLTNPTEE